MSSDDRLGPRAEAPADAASGHPPLRREDMVVLDLWDGPEVAATRHSAPDGRRLRLLEVARILYAAWLAPLGVRAELPDGARPTGGSGPADRGGGAGNTPALVLRHPQAGKAYAASSGLGTAVEPAGPRELWVLAFPEEIGYLRLWDEVAGLRMALWEICGQPGWPDELFTDEVAYAGWGHLPQVGQACPQLALLACDTQCEVTADGL